MMARIELNAWEYSFGLHTCRLSERTSTRTNPFTRLQVDVPIDDGLIEAERRAVVQVFETYGAVGPEPEFEGYALYLPGNGNVRIRGVESFEAASVPITSLSVGIALRQMTNVALEFVLDVAREGNFALVSATGDNVCLVAPSDDPIVNRRWPGAGIISTTDQLLKWLTDDIGGRAVHMLPGSR